MKYFKTTLQTHIIVGLFPFKLFSLFQKYAKITHEVLIMNPKEFIPMIILAQKDSHIYPNTDLPVTLWFYLNDISFRNKEHKNIIYMQK